MLSVQLRTESGRFDPHRCFRHDATALLSAPLDAVFDSLLHKEQLNDLRYSALLLRAIESMDQRTRVLEWGGPPAGGEL
jgi:hypothetical protein